MHIVSAPEDVARTMRPLLDGLGQEGVAVLHLGARNQALRLQLVALGTLNAAAVEPREVFRAAVGVGAASVVVAHNHPSGSAEPSDDDVRITRRLKACGQTLGIELLDHIVLGETDWVSLRERGLL
jgi:DNA repair protein RadC